MKLTLGCGFDKREGWLNVDNFVSWRARVDRGEITLDQLRQEAAERWNVARELQVTLRVVKT